MKIKKVKLVKCSLNIGELHLLNDFEHFNPVFECEDESGEKFKATMRLHISEKLDGLIFADPRQLDDEGIYVNSVGSNAIARKESFIDELPENIFTNKQLLKGITLYQLNYQNLITAVLDGYNFEDERTKYLNGNIRNLKVAFTCHDPNIIGGGNVILFRLINWLNDLGAKVTVYSCGTPPTWKRVNAVFKCFNSYKEMFESIEERVVVIYSMWHIEPMIKANPKNKLIYHLRQVYEPYHYGSNYETMLSNKFAIELLESLPIGLITISPHLKEYYKKFHNLGSHLIINGIDSSVFYPTEKVKSIHNEYCIISVGNPDHFVKGTAVLLLALKTLALKRQDISLKWKIMTGTQGRIDLKNIPENLTIEQFVGQNQTQMRKHYSNADIFVNSSLYEGFGLPTIEAMLCGTPVIQADNLGLDYIIDGKDDCILVPVNNEKIIAEAIEKLIEDKVLYNKLRIGGYNKALNYSISYQFEMFLREFETILDYKFDKERIEIVKKNIRYDHNNHLILDSALLDNHRYNPLVSVIIPSYNQAEFLREALDSLIDQTYKNWEAVIINDGSEDNTKEVMTEYAAKDNRIRPFSKSNGGITSALNAGLEKAHGEYFCWLSSDDLFYPDKIKLQVNAFEGLDDSYALVYGSFDILNQSSNSKNLQIQPLAQPIINGCEFPEALKFDFIDGCTIMIRMNVMRELGGFNPGIIHSQDMELWVRIASRGYRFHLLPHKLTIRRVHVEQSSTLNMIYCRYDAAWIINYYLENYHLLDMYRYLNINSEKGIKAFIEHFVSRTFDTEANINHPLLQEKYWKWFTNGITALPIHIQNVLLKNCLIYFIQNQKITYKIKYFIEQCINEMQKDRVFIPRSYDYSYEGRDFREYNRSIDSFANELFEYGLNLLVNDNTTLFAQELYFHNTNKLVNNQFKLAHSVFRYLSQFNNPYRNRINSLVGFEKIPNNKYEAIELFVGLSFSSISLQINQVTSAEKSSNILDVVEKYIPKLLPYEKDLLKRICSKNPTTSILYFWNALLFYKENKITQALEEAWKVTGFDLAYLPVSVFKNMKEWAKSINDIEKEYYLTVIYSHIVDNKEIISEKDILLKQFIKESGLTPQLNREYKKKPIEETGDIVINEYKIIPRLDGNYQLIIHCNTPNNKPLNLEGILPYQPVLYPKIVNDFKTGKQYILSPQQIYNFLSHGYNFYESFEHSLIKRLSNKNQINVAFISPYTNAVNGGTLVALRMANWLFNLGVNITVYSIGEKPTWFDLECGFISMKNQNELYSSIKEDVIITHSVLEIPYVLQFCKNKKRIYHLAQVIEDFHYHGHNYNSLMTPKGEFEMLHSLPIGRISISKHIDSYLKKHYKQNSYLIENGIDVLNFKPNNRSIPTRDITITTVGNTQRMLKGIDDVIEAVEILTHRNPKYKFNLIIVSNEKVGFEQILKYKSYNFNVTIINNLSQKEIKEIYLKSNFYVNASWYEGFGLPSLEAMACGIPVIQANNKGLDQIIIDGENCIIFQPANPKDLCLKIESLLGNEEKISKLVNGGLKIASDYSLAKHFDSFINVFEKILIFKFNGEKVNNLRRLISEGDYNSKLDNAKYLLFPKISIIIPIWRNEAGLEETINSIIAQSYDNWEINLVFNEIDDNYFSLIKSIIKLNDKIKYIKVVSPNYADLLNAGLQNTRGNWLIILHPGVVYSPIRFKSLMNNIELHPDKEMFYTEYYFKNKQANTFEIDYDSIEYIPFDEYQLFTILVKNNININSAIFKTDLIIRSGGFDRRYGSFTIFNLLLNIHKKVKSVFVLNNSCVILNRNICTDTQEKDDQQKVISDFLKNTPFTKLFPFSDWTDEIKSLHLVINAISLANSEQSLLKEKFLNDLFNKNIKCFVDLTDNKKISGKMISLFEINNKFDINIRSIFDKSISELYKKLLIGQKSEFPLKSNKNIKKAEINETVLVSIIALTYNQLDYTKSFIESVKNNTETSYELILIDNASNQETVDYLKSIPLKDNRIKISFNHDNLGFPKGVNQAIKISSGKYLLIANNDIVVTKSWLENLVKIAESDNNIGIIAPISNCVSGVQLDSNAKYKTIPQMHKYAAKISNENAGQTFEFPRVAFLCTLIKKEVIDKIGGLDERFSPGNFEDDDFCLRAQMAGYKTVIAKDVFIHHYGSKSFTAEGKDKYLARLDINKQIFIQKWGADPEEIWLQNKPIKKKNLNYPINKDLFVQHFQRALIQIEEKEFDLALKSLEDSLIFFHSSERKGVNTEFIDILNLAGNVSLFLNENEKAKYFFEEELKLTPSSSRACLGLGSMFFNIQNYNNAKSMFECAIKNDPLNQKAKGNLQSVNKLLGLELANNSLLESNEKEDELDSTSPGNGNILLKDNIMNIKSRNNFGHLLNAMELLGHGVEVGVQAGEFSKIIRSSWNGKLLHLVDRWKHDPNYTDIANVSDDDQKKLYLQVVSMFADDSSVSIHRMDSLAAADSFPDNYFDWVYIDADHSYEGCKADLNAWYPKLKPHGIFAGHDFIDGNYNAGNFGVKSAVEEFISDKNVQLNLTSGDYLNSWYFEKSSVAVKKDIAQIHGITDSNPDKLIDEAREFQERKDYKAALSKLTLAESLFNGHLSSPQNADFASAFFSLKGYNYLGDRDYDKAKECFEKALNLNPKSSEACSGLGDLFVLNGDNENAKIMYEWAIKNNPYNNYPKEALEKINFSPAIVQNFIPVEDEKKQNASEIRSVLEKILASIFELFNLKEFDEALFALNKNEQLFYSQFRDGGNNDIVSAYENMKGFVYLGLDQIDNAHSSFETALNLNPDSSQSSAGLGEVLYLQGEDEKAKKMFEWSLRNEPNNLFAKAGLEKVNKLLQQSQVNSSAEQEEERIQEVLEKILNAAYEIFNLKRFREALKALEENQQLFYSQYRDGENNEIISAYENLKGFIYLGLNENDNARASFEMALNLNPDSSQACAGLGEVFYLQSEDEKAKKMFEWSLKNEPENLFAKAGLEKVNELLKIKQDLTYNA